MKNLRTIVLTIVSIFSISKGFFLPPLTPSIRDSKTSISSIFDDDDDNTNDKSNKEKNGVVDFEKFNPLNYKASKSNSAYSYSGTQISLRKTRMQELTNELLNAAGNESAMNDILQDYKDFLIEPLEDPEAVLVGFLLSPFYFFFCSFVSTSWCNNICY